MSFEHEHTATTTASPSEVWKLWSDIGSWHRWDPSVQHIALEGHFAEGAAGTMMLTGDVEARFAIEIVEPGKRFVDRLTIGDVKISVDHVITPNDEGSSIVVTTHIDGSSTSGIGATIEEDTPKMLAALVELAEKRTG